LLVSWDGSPIHRRAIVQEFVSGTHGKVRLEPLPGYAPDLKCVGRRRLAPPQERGDAQPRVPGPGAVASGVPSGRRSPQAKALAHTLVLCSSRVGALDYVNFFMQRSVSIWNSFSRMRIYWT